MVDNMNGERSIEWRSSDRSGLRDFLRLSNRETAPDHSCFPKMRSCLRFEVHEALFACMLVRLDEHGLVKGGRISVDASTIGANTALRAIMHQG